MPHDPLAEAATLPPPVLPVEGQVVTGSYIHRPAEEAATLPQTATSTGIPIPQVPRYEILEELGRGGMGVVYKARQLGLNRLVALKMILAGSHAGTEHLNRFKAEATAIAQLRHPHIVQVYDIGEHEGLPYFSLEFVDGGSLEQRLKGHPQPPTKSAALVEKLARGVQAAHDHGIIHRDLKPANILLAPASEQEAAKTGHKGKEHSVLPTSGHFPSLSRMLPKITDFGLAKTLETDSQHTKTGVIMGTPSYMAPEQAEGKKDLTPAVDIYALGAILYEMLTGRPPFRAATPLDTVLQVVSDEPVPPRQLQSKTPKDLETICLKCLEKDPRKRYPTAAALAEDLRQFQAGESIQARPASRTEKIIKWCRRRPAVAALILVGLWGILGICWQWYRAASALVEAEAERNAAQQAKELAEKEKHRAELLLKKAVEAVDHMLQRVTDTRLARLPDFQEERQKILEEAVAFQRDLLRLESTDPSVRRETGHALYRMADLYWNLGRLEEAAKTCDEAIALQEKLLAEFPQQHLYRHDLAASYVYRGHILSTVARTEEGLKAYERGLALSEIALRQQPQNMTYGKTMTMAHISVGYFNLRDFPLAERHLRAALQLAKSLQQHTNDPECQCLLAGCYVHLAFVYFTHRRSYREAAAYLEQAQKLLEPATGGPLAGTTTYEMVLGQYCLLQGYMAAGRNNIAEAERQFRKSIDFYENLLRVQPKSFPYRIHLPFVYVGLFQTLEKSKPTEAEAALLRAAEVSESLARDYPIGRLINGGGLPYRLQLWRRWLYQGRWREAVADAEKLAGRDGSGTNYYNAGCLHAMAAAGISKETKLPASERAAQAEEHFQQAISWLRKAQDRGYFKERQTVEQMKKDKDLDGIRSRTEYQQLLRDVEAALSPSPSKGAAP
jgi:tetratricopeptide (TPR) repeat protein